MKKIKLSFTKFEYCLLIGSLLLITLSFFLFDGKGYFSYIASLIGAVALVFCAKGNPFGQVLVIVFSTLYAVISYKCAYFGEMITYAGMTLPMAIICFISWFKNPYGNSHAEVKVNKLKKLDFAILPILVVLITTGFYFVLKVLGTTNLTISTISIATSFTACYLTFKRSPFYAIAYAVNDVVLIILWSLTLKNGTEYLSVIVCFTVFLVNDIYGFINWQKLKKKQQSIKD